MLDIRVAVAKVASFASTVSGDTLEVVERPTGGFSFILVDGQGTGRGAKSLSNLLAARAIARLKDNAPDWAVVRAVHDYLYTYRMGQVSATINLLSVDFARHGLVMVRNNPAPFFVLNREGAHIHNTSSTPVGLYASEDPLVTELSVEPYTYLVLFTDGLLRAGERFGEDVQLINYLSGWPVAEGRPPEELCEELLAMALEVAQGEPEDDISIVVLAVLPVYPSGESDRLIYPVRRMNLSAPFEGDAWSE